MKFTKTYAGFDGVFYLLTFVFYNLTYLKQNEVYGNIGKLFAFSYLNVRFKIKVYKIRYWTVYEK